MAEPQRFRLDVNIRISALDPQYGNPMSGGLEVREQADLTLGTFMEVAKVLGHFHDLTEALKVDPEASPVWSSSRG